MPKATLTSRGYRGRGNGRVANVPKPRRYTGTTSQVCGMWPWAVGSVAPTMGVPLGSSLTDSPTTVGMDPIAWFEAGLIGNPSEWVEGMPGLGKSTFVRKQVIGMAGRGIIPIIPGDLKPDYVPTIRALGGQVVSLGRGVSSLNIVALGAMDRAAQACKDLSVGALDSRRAELVDASERLKLEAHERRLSIVLAQQAIVRGERIFDYEEVALGAALRVLAAAYRRRKKQPVMADLYQVLEDGPEEVRRVTLDRGEDARYRAAVQGLQRTFLGWLNGPLNEVFGRPTSVELTIDNPGGACLDVSRISANDKKLQSAALLACWAEGYGQVEASNALADVGAGPQRRYFLALDEMWRPLSLDAPGLIDGINGITRLNRNEGVGQAMITHGQDDLKAMRSEADRAKARGFIARAGAFVTAGLPRQEVDDLAGVVPMTAAERSLVSSWATPTSWNPSARPPGVGKLLIKVGERPGIPLQTRLTQAELDTGLHNTNKRWESTGA